MDEDEHTLETIGDEVMALLRDRGVSAREATMLLANVILNLIEQLANDPQDAVVGTQMLANDMVKFFWLQERAVAHRRRWAEHARTLVPKEMENTG